MSIVRLTTELPISADAAFALAQKAELFKFVVAPIIRVPRLQMPPKREPGAEASARLWWLGIVPTWRHYIRLVRLGDGEIYTNEHGGPVRTWNHRLTFEPLTDDSCRYTDEIETDRGLHGLPTRLFVRLMFRYRHRRWHTLAGILAETSLRP